MAPACGSERQNFPVPTWSGSIAARTIRCPANPASPLPQAVQPATRNPTMQNFNYNALAELYPSRRYAKSQQAQYRRFDKAADAVRYIIEEMPSKWLNGSFLEVDEQRFEGEAIRRLYDAPEYPLDRTSLAA